jgi:HEPN domain-containing protein
MTDIEKIVKQISALYEQFAEPAIEVPLAIQARELMFRARDYIAAASIVEREGMHHWLPMLQLTGHAVELSLKACLASANIIFPVGHDLVGLCRHVQGHGFKLDSPMCAAIVHLQHFYFEDLATGTRYKARYPSKLTERLGGAVPSNSTFTTIVSALLDQAARRAGAQATRTA